MTSQRPSKCECKACIHRHLAYQTHQMQVLKTSHASLTDFKSGLFLNFHLQYCERILCLFFFYKAYIPRKRYCTRTGELNIHHYRLGKYSQFTHETTSYTNLNCKGFITYFLLFRISIGSVLCSNSESFYTHHEAGTYQENFNVFNL